MINFDTSTLKERTAVSIYMLIVIRRFTKKSSAYCKITAFLFLILFTSTNSYSQVTVTGGGADGTYTSLTGITNGLFNYLNTNTITGNVMATITADINETGAVTLTTWNESGVGNYRLTIQSDGVSNHNLYGNMSSNAPLIPINFSTVSRVVTLTGGSKNYLTFINTNSTAGSAGPVISLGGNSGSAGLASGSSISNISVQGNASTAADGAIVIGGGANTVTISNSNISDATVGSGNLANVNTGPLATGIYSNNANNVLSISDNSFYAANTDTMAQVAIDLVSVGSGNSVAGNYIGGAAALCGSPGTPWTNSGTVNFTGIYMNAGATSASAIIGNTIENLSFTGKSSGFYGIDVGGGYVNVGVQGSMANGNTISAIAFTNSNTGPIDGIAFTSSATSNNSISNNTITGITTTSTGSFYSIVGITAALTGGTALNPVITSFENNTVSDITYAYNGGSSSSSSGFYGLYVPPSSFSTNTVYIGDVTGNTIGANSQYSINGVGFNNGSIPTGISVSTAASGNIINGNYVEGIKGQPGAWIYGIYLSAGSTTPSIITSNTIQQIYIGNPAGFRGIYVISGLVYIGENTSFAALGNTITNITYNGSAESAVGIYNQAGATGSIISNNTISGWTCTTASGFTAIALTGSTVYNGAVAEIAANKIQNISLTGGAGFTGISSNAGLVNIGVSRSGVSGAAYGNIIGDPAGVDSIAQTGTASVDDMNLQGIVLASASTVSCQISNNTIAYLSSDVSTSSNYFLGIILQALAAAPLIQGNTIENITLRGTGAAGTTGGPLYGIYASAVVIAGATIGGSPATRNYIGGSTSNIINLGPGAASVTGGIFLSLTAGAATYNINDNMISGFTFASTGSCYGIDLTNTMATGTTIDSNNISNFTVTGAGTTFYGIFANVATASVSTIEGDTVAGITMSGTAASTFTGINLAGEGNIGASGAGNIIGSSASPISYAGTGTAYGIRYGSAGTTNISHNRVGYINAQNGKAAGIYLTGGTNTTSYDTINSLYSNVATAADTAINATVIGIYQGSATAGQTVENNLIYSLGNTQGSGAVAVEGIYFAGATAASPAGTIAANFIQGLSLSTSGTGSQLIGIYLFNTAVTSLGVNNVYDNMVELGINAAGSPMTTGYDIKGIWARGKAGSNNFDYNSVYIGGTDASQVKNTYALLDSNTNTNARCIQNNIFYNDRTTGGSVNNYGYGAANNSATTSYNDIYGGSSGSTDLALVGGTNYTAAQLSSFCTSCINSDPLYLDPTGDSTMVSLNIQTLSPAAGAGTPPGCGESIPYDIYGTPRNSTHPTMGADEIPPFTSTWLGGTTDWFTAGNWNPTGVPDACAASVVIPSGLSNYPVISSANVSVGNVSIAAGASITLQGENLNICGNWTGGSRVNAVVAGSGAVLLNGSSAQTISGYTQFNTLQISNSNGVSLQSTSSVTIESILQLADGAFDATNGTVILASTSATSAAYIDNFSPAASPDNGTYSGNITAQRYYGPPTASNDFNQHMLGSPVSGINLSAMGSTTAASAYYEAATGGSHNCNELLGETGTPYGNVFSYVESHASSCVQNGWLVGASSTPDSAGKGYSVVLGSGSGTLSLTGPPNLVASYNRATTNSGYSPTTSDQGNVYPPGINLLSNPYPASLDPNKLIADNSNYNGAVYVWKESSGSYYQPSTIAPFQAFKVIETDPGLGNYAINGTSRTTTAGTFQRTTNSTQLNITVTNNGTGLTDETTVGFNPAATAGFDQPYDLIKLPGAVTRHTLYSVNGQYWMWRNIYNSINQTATVVVGFRPGVSGAYTASFNGLNSFDPTSYVTLEDLQLGVMHDVRSGDYTFNSAATDNFNRFVLHFTPPASITTTDATCSEQGIINIIQPAMAIWNYTLADNNNVTLSAGTLNSASPVTASVPAGVYTLTLVDNNGYTVVKTIEVNGVQPVVASFTTSGNTVNVNQEVTLSSTAAAAVFNNWNFGDGTTGNGATVSHAYANEGVYNIILNSISASGCNSSASNTITVTQSITGVTDLNDINRILIWSNEDIVNVDFTQLRDVQANIEIYNILGQKLCEDKYVTSAVYRKEIPNIEEGYIVVSVKNNDAIITQKLFISNVK